MIAVNRRSITILSALAAALACAAVGTGQECPGSLVLNEWSDTDACPGGFCPVPWGGGIGCGDGYQVTPKRDFPNRQPPFDERFRMVVRVKAESGYTTYGATGVIVDADGTRAWVLTAYHTFRNGGRPVVTLYDGRTFAAVISDKDDEADLARLMIKDPGITAIDMEDEAPRPGEDLWAMGFNGGPGTDNFRTFHGKMTQYVTADREQKYDLVELACAVRKGDSGGPIINSRGRLVGIIKGSDGQCCNGPCLPRLRAVVRWLLPGRKAAYHNPAPPAGSPPVPPPPVRTARPPAPDQTDNDPAIRQLEARIATLEMRLEAASKLPGPPGKDGKNGSPGPAAVVDYERLAADIAQRIVPGEPDYDKIAAEVAKRLPPIRVQTLKAGKVLAEEKIVLGGVLPLNLVPVKAKK